MIVRSYTGRTVAEALEKVRRDLGEGALIIETRTVAEPGLFGRRVGYEVIAASDPETERDASRMLTAVASFAEADAEPAPRRASSRGATALATDARRATALAGDTRRATAVAELEPPRIEAGQASRLAGAIVRDQKDQPRTTTALDAELSAIRRQLARLATGAGTPIAHLGDALATTLEASELPAEMIAELDDCCARAADRLDPAQRRAFAALWLGRAAPCAGAIDWSTPRRLMVVGPTGVGKTTTIAKLAGELRLKRGARVALATIDTYRVGATDQLRAYADLLDVPLEVAQTPAQLGAVLERFAGYDHVLIDTAGRAPADATRVHELKGFCRASPGIEVMLAVAGTAGRAEFASIAERFSLLPLGYGVVTKLDECAAPGRLIGCLRRHRLPVNYFATGQEVPEDIVAADATLLPARCLATDAAAAA